MTASLKRDGLLVSACDGLELRLGEPTDIRLKLAVARRALRRLPTGTRYLDVSVPGRPVAGATLKSQVEVYGWDPRSPIDTEISA